MILRDFVAVRNSEVDEVVELSLVGSLALSGRHNGGIGDETPGLPLSPRGSMGDRLGREHHDRQGHKSHRPAEGTSERLPATDSISRNRIAGSSMTGPR